jgi:hypothetical protein
LRGNNGGIRTADDKYKDSTDTVDRILSSDNDGISAADVECCGPTTVTAAEAALALWPPRRRRDRQRAQRHRKKGGKYIQKLQRFINATEYQLVKISRLRRVAARRRRRRRETRGSSEIEENFAQYRG